MNFELFALAHAHSHKSECLPDSAALALASALAFYYSVLFKALFNTLFIFKMMPHAHTCACIEINAANNAELHANVQNVHILMHAE